MVDWKKTTGTSLYALTNLAAASCTAGGSVDVTLKGTALIAVQFGRGIATAGGASCKIRVQGQCVANEWQTLLEWWTNFAAVTYTAMDAESAAAQPNVYLGATAGFTAGQLIYIRDTITPANGEWKIVKSVVTDDYLVCCSNLLYTHAHTTSFAVTDGQQFAAMLDLTTVKAVRLFVDALVYTQTFDVKADMNTLDSIG